MNAGAPPRSAAGNRGSPLVMLLVLLGTWAMLRMVWWDDPFAPSAAALASTPPAAAGIAPRSLASPLLLAGVPLPEAAYDPAAVGLPVADSAAGEVAPLPIAPPAPRPRRLVAYRAAPNLRLGAAEPGWSLPPGTPRRDSLPQVASTQDHAPYLPARASDAAQAPAAKKPRRWSIDSWAFYRQSSTTLVPAAQGRAPTYGASQAGTLVQYRRARSSRHDPRLYLRGYSALDPGTEREAALGASARPLAGVPLRIAAEARYTEFPSGRTAVRPAAYAVTELAPIRLPLGSRLDAYAQGGWVGGPSGTLFADGQASVTREFGFVGRMSRDALRLSFGAGAWGGAQEGAQRLDVGPTVRLDLKVGRAPARVSVDWRQRVAGDAVPNSGVAATIATGF